MTLSGSLPVHKVNGLNHLTSKMFQLPDKKGFNSSQPAQLQGLHMML